MNEQFVAIEKKVYTANVIGRVFENIGARGVCLFLSVTKAPETGYLSLDIRVVGNQDNVFVIPFAWNDAIRKSGTRLAIMYPGAETTQSEQIRSVSLPLPLRWRIGVIMDNPAEWEFGVTACYIG